MEVEFEIEKSRCEVPPDRWVCSRAKGHDGPCAAHPAEPLLGTSHLYLPKAAFTSMKARLEAERDQLQNELLEQARLVGMGAEREFSLIAERDQLKAARIAYASEFPPDENGDPDVGNIHANIRALKANTRELELELRKHLWLGHGHTGMYGDDGEMQCMECAKYGCADYKHEPMNKVLEAFRLAQIDRLGVRDVLEGR